jgi:hypothetical protein
MKDHLLDLVKHTYDLGLFDLIKVTGTEEGTEIVGVATDQTVVLDGKFNGPVAEFVGKFGMPNLGKLKILLNLEAYKENSKLEINYKQSGEPDSIDFENNSGDFKNSYRFMVASVIDSQLKTPKFRGVTWHIEVEPTVLSIQRLRMQAQAHAEEVSFQIKTENNNLVFSFGNHSTHEGNFVFESNVSAQLKRSWSYPVKPIINILGLTGDKTFNISDDGCAQITVSSGLGTYKYIILALTK